jgi:putative transposase
LNPTAFQTLVCLIESWLLHLIALSNGETVARPNWTKRAAKSLRRRQRAFARCKRGSSTPRKRVAALAKFSGHVAAKRRDFCHKLSCDLVKRFGRIAVEDLNIKGMARGMLAKHVYDAAWAQIVSNLRYKAACAGVELAEVDPPGTSQTCSECGVVAPKTLATREHCCASDCSLGRDVAAAIVVHQRAFGSAPERGVES